MIKNIYIVLCVLNNVCKLQLSLIITFCVVSRGISEFFVAKMNSSNIPSPISPGNECIFCRLAWAQNLVRVTTDLVGKLGVTQAASATIKNVK